VPPQLEAPPPRRGRALSLDALVAAALILHLRCIDPVTGLPCPPELLVERLAATRRPPAPRRTRLPVPLRAVTAAISRFLAGWWAGR
jgi:capsular polysaccharide export protein